MSTVSHDEESEEEVSSPKRIRSESDDETTTVSNEDIVSLSDEGKSPEEMNDSYEEADPWVVLIHEAAAELRTKHNDPPPPPSPPRGLSLKRVIIMT